MNPTILAFDVADMAADTHELIFAQRIGRRDAAFFFYHPQSGTTSPAKAEEYLRVKFGQAGSIVAQSLKADIYTCRAVQLRDGGCAALTEDATLHVFSADGRHKRSMELLYKNAAASGLAYDGNEIWYCCPKQNCIVQYSMEQRGNALRIGNAQNFVFPHALSFAQGNLFVCCGEKGNPAEIKIFSAKELDIINSFSFPKEITGHAFLDHQHILWCGSELYRYDPEVK
jgi:hypothetical protein